jgi:hypothetical protein
VDLITNLAVSIEYIIEKKVESESSIGYYLHTNGELPRLVVHGNINSEPDNELSTLLILKAVHGIFKADPLLRFSSRFINLPNDIGNSSLKDYVYSQSGVPMPIEW